MRSSDAARSIQAAQERLRRVRAEAEKALGPQSVRSPAGSDLLGVPPGAPPHRLVFLALAAAAAVVVGLAAAALEAAVLFGPAGRGGRRRRRGGPGRVGHLEERGDRAGPGGRDRPGRRGSGAPGRAAGPGGPAGRPRRPVGGRYFLLPKRRKKPTIWAVAPPQSNDSGTSSSSPSIQIPPQDSQVS